MNLDKLTVSIRPLSAYQAMDLGMAMARAWYGELWQLWWRHWWLIILLTAIGIYGQYHSLQMSDVTWQQVLSIVLIWWCKPLFERDMMIYLSQKLFDEDYGVDDVADTGATLSSVRFMLLRRLSYRRMLIMPVYVLEGQKGRAAKTRIRQLSRRQDNAVTAHSIGFVVMELMLWIGVYLCIGSLFSAGGGAIGKSTSVYMDYIDMVLVVVCYVGVVSLVTPFYVASGFAMYLCKRSLLEGWDIELTFRKLIHRYRSTKSLSSQTSQNTSDAAVMHSREQR